MKQDKKPHKSNLINISIQKVGQLFTLAILIVIVALLIGCSKRYHDMPAFLAVGTDELENHGVGRFKTTYVVEQIDNFYRGTSNGPIGVTTLVNLDDLYSTSSFGRMYAEQIISELAMRGFDVIEMRHSDALQFLADSGEFALSRDIGSIKRAQNLAGVVVGTYVSSPERVYVNVRMVDPTTSLIVSSASAEMSKTKELARMLRGGSLMPTLERIPVRHLGRAVYPATFAPMQVVPIDDGYGEPAAPQPKLQSYSPGNADSNVGANSEFRLDSPVLPK